MVKTTFYFVKSQTQRGEFYMITSDPSTNRIGPKMDIFVVFDTDDFRSILADEKLESGKNPPDLSEVNSIGIEQDIGEARSQASKKSTRYLNLKTGRELPKTRQTKAENHVAILATGHPNSKMEIRRALEKH